MKTQKNELKACTRSSPSPLRVQVLSLRAAHNDLSAAGLMAAELETGRLGSYVFEGHVNPIQAGARNEQRVQFSICYELQDVKPPNTPWP